MASARRTRAPLMSGTTSAAGVGRGIGRRCHGTGSGSRTNCDAAHAGARIDCSRRRVGLWLRELTDMDNLMRTVVSSTVLAALAVLGSGCTPTVKVATDEPITINLNVNIKHEILVKVDRELDELFSDDSDLF
jgi:hypothetical protein